MASRPLKPCAKIGCKNLTTGYYCEEHKHEAKKFKRQKDKQRPSASQRGYGSRWRKARRSFLLRNPLCARCAAKGIVRQATVVDHIVPHKGDPDLFWDEKNWQPLCEECHNIKTATEDGGFGR